MRLRKMLGLLLLLILTSLTAATGVSAAPTGCALGDCNDVCSPCGGRLYTCYNGYPICACYQC